MVAKSVCWMFVGSLFSLNVSINLIMFKSFFKSNSNVSLYEKDMYKINKELLEKTDLETAKYILNEAKEFLNHTINESAKITNRAYSILSIYITFLSASCGYLIINHSKFNGKMYFVLVFVLIVALFIGFLFKITFPRKISYKGVEPFKLVKSPMLNDNIKKESKYSILILNEIKFTQTKIDFNKQLNNKRTEILKYVMLFSPIILFVYFIVSFIIIINYQC